MVRRDERNTSFLGHQLHRIPAPQLPFRSVGQHSALGNRAEPDAVMVDQTVGESETPSMVFELEELHGGKPWVTDINHWNFQAARAATKVHILIVHLFKVLLLIHGVLQAVYNKDPDMTREGGSIPVTLTFAEALGVNVLLLPMGRGDDGSQ